jgi:hypothetical protein
MLAAYVTFREAAETQPFDVAFGGKDGKTIAANDVKSAEDVAFICVRESNGKSANVFVGDEKNLPLAEGFLRRTGETTEVRFFTPQNPNPPKRKMIANGEIASIILSVVGKLGLTAGSVLISGTLGALIGGHFVLYAGYWIAISLGILIFFIGIGCEVAAKILA